MCKPLGEREDVMRLGLAGLALVLLMGCGQADNKAREESTGRH